MEHKENTTTKLWAVNIPPASDFKSSMILKNMKYAVAHGLDINDGALVLKTDDNGNIVMMINKE